MTDEEAKAELSRIRSEICTLRVKCVELEHDARVVWESEDNIEGVWAGDLASRLYDIAGDLAELETQKRRTNTPCNVNSQSKWSYQRVQ